MWLTGFSSAHPDPEQFDGRARLLARLSQLYSATCVLTHGSPSPDLVPVSVTCGFCCVALGPTVRERECLVFSIPVTLGFSIGTVVKRT